jgi:ATP-binding cassette subfamily B protein
VYDPTEGQIFINDIPLSEYYLESWRKGLSIMNQDYRIFDEETIKENIVFDAKVNNEYLQQVVHESGVDSYLHDYKNGIDQLIGKEFRGGVELSKGQNQKMILARTLYRNTPLIILDEPTAAIDALSEDKIFKALRNNHKEQTRVIISHKFSNVRDADKIILIEHGQIIEQGNHDQLMKIKKGKYKELFELQAEGYK